MEKTRQMLEVEAWFPQWYQKNVDPFDLRIWDIRDILKWCCTEYGNTAKAAEFLKITRAGFSKWVKILEGEIKTIVVFPNHDTQ